MLYSIPFSYFQFFKLLLFISLINIPSAFADSVEARCDVYPKGEDHSDVSIPCVFSQQQGGISIRRSDQVFHELTPKRGELGYYIDQNNDDVYREDGGLGSIGTIFRFKHESVYIYWDTVGLPNNTRKDYNSKNNQSSDKNVNLAYDQKVSLLGISFHVSCSNDSSLNILTIKPSALKGDNSVIRQEIDGTVTRTEVADLNADGSPEIYVYINSVGSGSYGNVIAYSANNNKSLSSIYFPPISDDKVHSKGYMGHDEFMVVENSLVRRFPLYKKNDTNSKPTGGKRDVEYKLVAGEASWQLKLVKSSDF